jgi:hypothetical protein
MHRVHPDYFRLDPVLPGLFRSDEFVSLPGNSGGPLCVQLMNPLGKPTFFPAGIYLGSSHISVIKEVDVDTADIIARAEIATEFLTDIPTHGIITIRGAQEGAEIPCHTWVDLRVGPADALAAGAAWRITNAAYYPYHDYVAYNTLLPVLRGGFTLEFKEIPGFASPANADLQTVCFEGLIVDARYEVLPPRLSVSAPFSLTVTGTSNTTYRLEFTSALGPESSWHPAQSFTLTNGSHTLNLMGPPASGARFYRAVWLPSP